MTTPIVEIKAGLATIPAEHAHSVRRAILREAGLLKPTARSGAPQLLAVLDYFSPKRPLHSTRFDRHQAALGLIKSAAPETFRQFLEFKEQVLGQLANPSISQQTRQGLAERARRHLVELAEAVPIPQKSRLSIQA